MDAVEVELLRPEVDRLIVALEAERGRHVAGLEPHPALVALFDAHSRAAHRRTCESLRQAGEEALAARVAALRAERVAAAHEEAWRAAESAARGLGPDGPASLAELALAVDAERDPERRRALGRAEAQAWGGAAGFREAAAEQRARARAELGLLPDWEQVIAADALLAASDDAWADVLGWLVRRELGPGVAPLPRGDLDRADLLHLLRLPSWSGLFPRGGLALAVRELAAPLRLDLSAVRVDDAARPAQWPGAHALGTRISLRRRGGAADWLDLLDATGRALAASRGPAPHARDPRFGAALGALLAGLLLDARFLAQRLGVERRQAADLVRALALRQLFGLRSAAAALRVAVEVERGTSGAAWHAAHVDALSLATLARWPEGLAARDADPAPHALRLAGAARGERLRAALVERFDEDWWRNPRSADALAGMLAAGATGLEGEPDLREGAAGLVSKLG